MKGKCSICGKVIRSHASAKNSASSNFLKAIRKHQWKNHRTTMIARIKAGKRLSRDDTSVQEFIKSLQGDPQTAYRVYKRLAKKDWKQLNLIMEVITPILPDDMVTTWMVFKAMHDA